MNDQAARRLAILILAILSIVVFARAVSPARGATVAAAPRGARVALYDPGDHAGSALRALGLSPEGLASPEDLALYRGDLIVIGPGGFARGREALGPVLAARARAGMRVLILEQPTLPGTLTEDLRLWPAFSRRRGSRVMVAEGHPVLDGLIRREAAAYLAGAPARYRPLLPPTRGNFRVLAEVRVRGGRVWQQGVLILESTLGLGTVIASQAPLCADSAEDPRARALLANLIAYLLDRRASMPRAYLYADSADDLPHCLAHFAPRAPRAPVDLDGVDVLLVPGDWRAPRRRSSAPLPAPSDVARFLERGGTIVLLNPQSLVLEYLRGLIGAAVSFGAPEVDRGRREPTLEAMLQGIDAEDLRLLAQPGRAVLRLRRRAGPSPVEPLLIAPPFAAYRVGRGTLVALTLPDTDRCLPPRPSGLLARLLTNLGVPLDHRPGVDPEAVSLLNR
ncbi:MAG: hypothetical protein ACE5JH_05395 [Acidobacteriota bacterium]